MKIPDNTLWGAWHLEAQTGGNCTAWSKKLPNTDVVAWITDADDPSVPTDPERVRLTYFGDSGDVVTFVAGRWRPVKDEGLFEVSAVCSLEQALYKTSLWQYVCQCFPLPVGYRDSSWGNDTCPSYESANGAIRISIEDYCDQSEFSELALLENAGPRFSVYRNWNGTDVPVDDSQPLALDLRSWDEVLQVLARPLVRAAAFPKLTEWFVLAEDARPRLDDWGSERQIQAENLFHWYAKTQLEVDYECENDQLWLDSFVSLDDYLLKCTTEEAIRATINEAIRQGKGDE